MWYPRHSLARLSALAGVALAGGAQAAPVAFQAAVLGDAPYVYYRLGDAGSGGSLTNQPADDVSVGNNDGIYRGNPVPGAAGFGAGGDDAVSFPGTSLAGLDYLRTTNNRAFGGMVGRSSYELLFRANTAGPTEYQAIFGVFNAADNTTSPARTGNGAVAIEFNSNATGNAHAGTSRFYVRDEDGIALGGVIDNGNLLDGNYHHLLFTYDNTDAGQQYVKAYVDGLAVSVALTPQGGGSLTNVPDNLLDFTVDPTFGARNVRGTVGLEANVTIDEAALYGNRVLSAADAAAHAAAAGFVVPEPGAVTLLGAGVVGLQRLRRRRR
jgi:hypothetical protein